MDVTESRLIKSNVKSFNVKLVYRLKTLQNVTAVPKQGQWLTRSQGAGRRSLRIT